MSSRRNPIKLSLSARILRRTRLMHFVSLAVIAIVAAAMYLFTLQSLDSYALSSEIDSDMARLVEHTKVETNVASSSVSQGGSSTRRAAIAARLKILNDRGKLLQQILLNKAEPVLEKSPEAAERYRSVVTNEALINSKVKSILAYLNGTDPSVDIDKAVADLQDAQTQFEDYAAAALRHMHSQLQGETARTKYLGIASVLAVILGLLMESHYIFRPLMARLFEAVKMEREREVIEKENAHLARLQRATEEAYRELEDHRTALQQQAEALRIALGRAEEANSLKSQFLANMSHEIRTPLNGVVGMTEILAGTRLSPSQKECVRTISSSAEALLKIINDILDLSKVEAGKLSVEPIPFDLRQILESVLDIHGKSARDKGVTVSYSLLPGTLTSLVGDPTRIRQIVVNLFSNAVKFTNEGSVKITAETFKNHGRLLLRIQVADTGIGIDADRISQLFDPFTQADGSTTREYGGTGLGLSIVKQLSELMGGWAGGSSVLDKGSEFWSVVEVQPAIVVETTEEVPRDLTVPHGLRVLLVEDNAVNQLVATRMLQAYETDLTIARNGAEAIERLIERNFDLILMDIHMPVMDGLEATRRIRQMSDPAKSRLPIVALTADAMEQDISVAIEAGMDDAISKPVRATVLREKLSKWVGQHELVVVSKVS
jgi:signal transduction histidine kinase/ActR/RegA family two-component response regulator